MLIWMRGVSIGVVAVGLGLAWQALSAPGEFVADHPSPLKLVRRGDGDETITRFSGKVRVVGRFLVAWDVVNKTPSHLRVTFMPDESSAALLPHPVGDAAVKEVLLSNNEAAAKLLLDRETAAGVLARDVLALTVEATVTISDFRSVVVCDQRVYLARLDSVTKSRGVVVAGSESKRVGC